MSRDRQKCFKGGSHATGSHGFGPVRHLKGERGVRERSIIEIEQDYGEVPSPPKGPPLDDCGVSQPVVYRVKDNWTGHRPAGINVHSRKMIYFVAMKHRKMTKENSR